MNWRQEFTEEQLERRKEYQKRYYHEHKHDPRTKEMRRIADRRRYRENPEKYVKYALDRRDNMNLSDRNFRSLVIMRARNRAKRSELPFDISVDDVVWNTHCPVLGIELYATPKRGEEGFNDSSLSLDKIDNSKGYTKGNVRTISNRANKLKNNMTREECELLLKNWDAI